MLVQSRSAGARERVRWSWRRRLLVSGLVLAVVGAAAIPFHGTIKARLRAEALDNDQDGELTGIELDGLAVWRDRNGDGKSDTTEVQPVWEQGITAIATTGSQGGEGVLRNPQGVRYEDGRVAPTHDWTVTPRALLAERDGP